MRDCTYTILQRNIKVFGLRVTQAISFILQRTVCTPSRLCVYFWTHFLWHTILVLYHCNVMHCAICHCFVNVSWGVRYSSYLFFPLFELWWLEYWIACVSVYFFCLFFVYCSHNSSSFFLLLLSLCSIEGILRLSLRQYIKYLYVFSKFWYHPEKLRRKLGLLKLVR